MIIETKLYYPICQYWPPIGFSARCLRLVDVCMVYMRRQDQDPQRSCQTGFLSSSFLLLPVLSILVKCTLLLEELAGNSPYTLSLSRTGQCDGPTTWGWFSASYPIYNTVFSPFHNPTICILYFSPTHNLIHTTIGCGKQGFPSAQPYLSQLFCTVNSQCALST